MNTSNHIFRFVVSFLLSVSASYLTLTSTTTTVRLQCLSKRSAGTSQDVVSHAGVAGASSCVLLYRGRFSWYSAHVRCHMQGLALADLWKYQFTQIEIGSDFWLTNGPPRLGFEKVELATECYMTSNVTKYRTDCSEQKEDVRFACAPVNVNSSGSTAGQGEQEAIDSESSSNIHPDTNKRAKVLSCPTTWEMMKLGDQVLSSCTKEVSITDSLNSNSTRPLTWIQTQRICAKQGGHLFWADDDLELQWFLNYLKELEEKIANIFTFKNGGAFFLHLDLHKRLYCENEWCWRSRLSIQNSSLIRWFKNQPNNSAKFDCAYYKYIRNNPYTNDNNGLNNIPCESISELLNNIQNKFPYQQILCKKELVHNSKCFLNYIQIQNSQCNNNNSMTPLLVVAALVVISWICASVVIAYLFIRLKRATESSSLKARTNDRVIFVPASSRYIEHGLTDQTDSSNAQNALTSSTQPPQSHAHQTNRSPPTPSGADTHINVMDSEPTDMPRGGATPQPRSRAMLQPLSQDTAIELSYDYSEALAPPVSSSSCAGAFVGHKSGPAAALVPVAASTAQAQAQARAVSGSSSHSPLYSEPYEMEALAAPAQVPQRAATGRSRGPGQGQGASSGQHTQGHAQNAFASQPTAQAQEITNNTENNYSSVVMLM